MALVRVAPCRRREVFVIPGERRQLEVALIAIVSSGSSYLTWYEELRRAISGRFEDGR
jgi:hypothetical protein